MGLFRLLCLIISLAILEVSFAQDSTIKVIEAYSLTDISVAFDQSEKELRVMQEKLENTEDIDGFFNEFHEILFKDSILRSDTSRTSIDKMSLNAVKDLSTEWTRYADKIKKIEEKTSRLNQDLEKQREKLEEY